VSIGCVNAHECPLLFFMLLQHPLVANHALLLLALQMSYMGLFHDIQTEGYTVISLILG